MREVSSSPALRVNTDIKVQVSVGSIREVLQSNDSEL